MAFGSLMNQSIADSIFEYAIIRVTGPSHGTSVTMTFSGGGTQNLIEVSNGVWEGKVSSKGTYTVKSTVSGIDSSSSVTVSVPKTYNVVLTGPSRILNNNSWSVIRKISDSGKASSLWSVGDRKAVTLNGYIDDRLTLNNFTCYVFILGFDHNMANEHDEDYNQVHSIHFQGFKTALSGGKDIAICDTYYGNSTRNDRSNGEKRKYVASMWVYGSLPTTLNQLASYTNSYMSKTTLNVHMLAALPTELQNNIKVVSKYIFTSLSSKSPYYWGGGYMYKKLWLISEFECTGAVNIGPNNAGTKLEANKSNCLQYAYYKAGNSVLKYKHDAQSTLCAYYLRTPDGDSAGSATLPQTPMWGAITTEVSSGTWGKGVVRYNLCESIGIAPCFCV